MYPSDLELPPTLNQDPSGRPPHFRAMYEYARKMKWPIKPDDFESGMRRLWRGYLACITHVDHAVGQLLVHLEKSKLADDTIVIYTADHGAYSGTHGLPEKAPGICSDAVCRVPLIWRVPGVTNRKPGAVSNHLVELVDLTPTFASLCNLPPMQTVDGRDISPILRDGDRATPVHDVAVTENVWSKAIHWKQWRFVHYPRQMFAGQDVGELYDIASDPDETKNLYTDPAHQNIVTESRRLLTDWLISTTRAKTIWPAPGDDATKYPTAEDGNESNTAGAAQRQLDGMLNYL
jgi:arylsulfatase A-like enzyme